MGKNKTFAANDINTMKNTFLSAPLPFVGQKRLFAKEFIKVLEAYPPDTVFVDLFGGSGLLSHLTKAHHPQATVVYNDYDNYRRRLSHIPITNRLLADLRIILADSPRGQRVSAQPRAQILARLEREEQEVGYVDYITLSGSLLFSSKYKTSLEELKKESLYNRIRHSDYPEASDYLQGLEVVCKDYKELFEQYKDTPGVVFLVDPPYLSTEVGTYTMSWRLADYLDVLTILQGHSFVYFTSNKSGILELCDWMGQHPQVGNPFKRCTRAEVRTMMTHNAGYTDMMLYT